MIVTIRTGFAFGHVRYVDHVVVTSGIDILLILRRTETHSWTPVGDTYTDGLMKGDGRPENADGLCDN